ncbi:MAG: amino acid adenylation domain-containing protein [Chloroflexota bacterium]|nr:amino acid adenylation domain-containing protein [Chloroflexota bacterium]
MTELLQEYVARQAQRRPQAVALAMGDERLEFGELEEASNRMARLIVESGCKRGDRVCLFVQKSPAAIVSMLATLKADCVYVPIDVASPSPRLEKIVHAADPKLILVDDEAAGLLDEVLAGEAVERAVGVASISERRIDGERFSSRFSRADAPSCSAEPLEFANTTVDPAHILFTSGSTGTPKGVVIKHCNAIHFVEWAARYFGFAEDDRISGHPPLHFDLSTFDIYGAALAGAELHLVPASMNLLPHKIAGMIRERELTQWFSVPSVMTFLAKLGVIAQGDFPTLRRVLWCGEVLPTPILIHWMQRVAHARFTNLYGPTETTIASSYYTVGALPHSERAPIPIGTPCDGEELLVLDERLRPVAEGETGDLYIAGAGLSAGYWRDPDKTRAAFIQDPRVSDADQRIYRTGDLARLGSDGLVYFLGRADSQVKSRGYRIELGEIEAALNAFADIRECAVVGVDSSGFEGTTLCCAFASCDGANVEPARVREHLAAVLPSYMLPSRWLALDVLPKNVNGKIDRRRLAEMFAGGAVQPATATA